MTRQRHWQLKQKDLGLCIICGRLPIFLHALCKKHYREHKEYARKRYQRNKVQSIKST